MTEINSEEELYNNLDAKSIVIKYEIDNLFPLTRMYNLRSLILKKMGTENLFFLRDLNLETLKIVESKVSDISPLQNMETLTELFILESNISDLSPLRNMTQLKWLCLKDGNLQDISPISSLNNLFSLYLPDNPKLTDISPLRNVRPKFVNLSGTGITDASPLFGREHRYALVQLPRFTEEQKKIIRKNILTVKLRFEN